MSIINNVTKGFSHNPIMNKYIKNYKFSDRVGTIVDQNKKDWNKLE